MSIKGKVAVVTGSNSGIGLGVAEVLAARGASVVLNSFTDSPEDHALARRIAEDTGAAVQYIQADMSDPDACRALIARAAKTFGGVDILVNNAGIQFVAPIEDFPAARWDAIIAINLSSAFHTTAAALPLMRKAGWGRVVNIASAHGLTASPFKSAYVAAKHGVVGLTKVTALETAREPITANAICPGYVLTPLVEAQIPDQMKTHNMDRETVIREVMLERQPSREFATTGQRRRRLDRAVTALHKPRTINLALQGGGAHGAFTWGVLDRLLDEERLETEGISGTSAGAMNAAMMKTGYLEGGNEGARRQLDRFWGVVRDNARANVNPFRDWLRGFSPEAAQFADEIYRAPGRHMQDMVQRTLSPSEWNPMNFNPLRDTLEELIDFDRVCMTCKPHLFVSASNVRSGKIRVFRDPDLSIDAILASACLPMLFQPVEIDGEHYWDGGYMGNPALFPLYDGCQSRDIVIVHVNPIERREVPKTARAILNRVNEISFNSSLLRELRAINFVRELVADGRLRPGEMKDILIHSIRDDDTMDNLDVSSKISPEPELLDHLKQAGRTTADAFLRQHWDKLGKESTVDLKAMFD
jgi:3-hydroxybutyrate dehydrogenase